MAGITDGIRKISNGIVAIGFRPGQDKAAIAGTGFCVDVKRGLFLSAAHLYLQIPEQYRGVLHAFVMQKKENDLENYEWMPIKKVEIDAKNDIALFQLVDEKRGVLRELEMGDSDKVEIGQSTYFIGFPYAANLINEGFGVTMISNRSMVSTIKRDGINPAHPRNFIVVDAISNPGNSGGPLIDEETNKVLGIMTISFRQQSRTHKDLDIREPMHIAAAKPINLAKNLID